MTAAAIAERLRIPPELLAAAGWRDASDAEVRDALGYGGHRGADLSGLLIPYRHPRTGEVLGHRVRLAHPVTGAGGEAKYLSTPAMRWLYFAPVPPEWLDDPTVPVMIVEAEKSALAGVAMDTRHRIKRVWIATGGISGWRRTITKAAQPDGTLAPVTGPSPSLDLLEWAGREVILFRDSNVAGRRDLMRASGALAHELLGRGAAVKFADAPKLEGVNGPDDLIAVAGDDAALDALAAARPFPEAARAEAEAAVSALEAMDGAARKNAPMPTAELADVGDAELRARLVGRIAALRIPGVVKPEIEKRVAQHRADAEAARRQAAEAARRGKLLGMRVDGAALLADLAGWLRGYVVMSAAQADACALWLLHGHALDAADYTPYLHITAPEKRCGKSRLLEALEVLAARAWRCDRTTAAALLRSVERDTPTLLLDEWDAAKGSGDEYAEAMRGLLNSGFRRGGAYRMCVGEDREPHDFATYCPKAIAGIGRLPDTVADRSLAIALRRKAPQERVAMFRRREAEPQAAYLRERCEAWAMQATARLREARPEFPPALNDRQRDIIEPLLAIADLAGGDWPERARRALVELCTGAAAADESIGARLLADVRAIFGERQAERIASKDLAEALGGMEDRPWAEWGRQQKPITPPQVARLLGRFGIAPRNLRDGTSVLKGYVRDDFAEGWARYLAPDPPPDDPPPPDMPIPNRYTATRPVNIGENRDFRNATATACSGSENGISASKDAGCSGVAVSNQQSGEGGCQADLFAPPVPPKADGETWGESIVRARREGRLPAAEPPARPAGEVDV
ncbi:MAG TPA: DUF3631 domain-containing protein [Terriglobales bacterium]|nr:DUF3631 domain-containing protein [Terriglobales bacterium]